MSAGRDPAVHLRHAFVRDGHLTSLPSRASMLDAACAFLAERFEADRLYDEREVNAILADDAPDGVAQSLAMVGCSRSPRSGGDAPARGTWLPAKSRSPMQPGSSALWAAGR